MKTKLRGDNKDKLKAQAIEKCQCEGWDLKVLGARFFGGYVAVLKRRRR